MSPFDYWLTLTKQDYTRARSLYHSLRESGPYKYVDNAKNHGLVDSYLRECIKVRANPLVLSKVAFTRQSRLGRPAFTPLNQLMALTTLEYDKIEAEIRQQTRESILSTHASLLSLSQMAKVEYGDNIDGEQLAAFIEDNGANPVVIYSLAKVSQLTPSIVAEFLRCPDVYEEVVPQYINRSMARLPRFEDLCNGR